MFKECAGKALAKVSDKHILSIDPMGERDMVILVFDSLLMDYAYISYSVKSEEFRALITKFDLLKDSNVAPLVNQIVDKLYDLNEGHGRE